MGLPGEEIFGVGAVRPYGEACSHENVESSDVKVLPLGKGCKFAAAFCPSEEHFLAQPSGFQAPKKSDFFVLRCFLRTFGL